MVRGARFRPNDTQRASTERFCGNHEARRLAHSRNQHPFSAEQGQTHSAARVLRMRGSDSAVYELCGMAVILLPFGLFGPPKSL